jgi:hypothetical protein
MSETKLETKPETFFRMRTVAELKEIAYGKTEKDK